MSTEIPAEIQALYDAAHALLVNCDHANKSCNICVGRSKTPTLSACVDCYNAQVYARREADKAWRAWQNSLTAPCQRCGTKPHRWQYGGYLLCGRCKTQTEKEHHRAVAGHGVLGIFATRPLVDTTTWAAAKATA